MPFTLSVIRKLVPHLTQLPPQTLFQNTMQIIGASLISKEIYVIMENLENTEYIEIIYVYICIYTHTQNNALSF